MKGLLLFDLQWSEQTVTTQRRKWTAYAREREGKEFLSGPGDETRGHTVAHVWKCCPAHKDICTLPLKHEEQSKVSEESDFSDGCEEDGLEGRNSKVWSGVVVGDEKRQYGVRKDINSS